MFDDDTFDTVSQDELPPVDRSDPGACMFRYRVYMTCSPQDVSQATDMLVCAAKLGSTEAIGILRANYRTIIMARNRARDDVDRIQDLLEFMDPYTSVSDL